MDDVRVNTYCNINTYLEVANPTIASILKQSCLQQTLNLNKRNNGMTFLNPDEKSMKKLLELAKSDNPADGEKLDAQLRTLIIPFDLSSAEKWKEGREKVHNSMRPYQHVDISSSSGSEVLFKSGAKATLDAKFNKTKKVPTLSVWTLNGEMATTSKPFEYPKKGAKGAITGSYAVPSCLEDSIRINHSIAVENLFANSISAAKSNGATDLVDGSFRNPYLESVLSMIDFVMNIKKDHSLLYGYLLPLYSGLDADYYIMFEPHKLNGHHIVSDNLFAEWYDHRRKISVAKVRADIDSALKNAPVEYQKYLIYSNRMQVVNSIDDLRSETLTVDRDIATNIVQQYDILDAQNQIGDSSPIYPPEIATLYSENKGLKLVHDELRFMTQSMLITLQKEPHFDANLYNKIVTICADYLHPSTEEERKNSLILTNPSKLKFAISPSEMLAEFDIFVNSDLLFNIPLTADDLKAYPVALSARKPTPNNNQRLWSTATLAELQHQRLAKSGHAPKLGSKTLDRYTEDDFEKLPKEELVSLLRKLKM